MALYRFEEELLTYTASGIADHKNKGAAFVQIGRRTFVV